MSALNSMSRCWVEVCLLCGCTYKGREVEENSRTWSSHFARAARLRTCQLYIFLSRYLTLNATTFPSAKVAYSYLNYG